MYYLIIAPPQQHIECCKSEISKEKDNFSSFYGQITAFFWILNFTPFFWAQRLRVFPASPHISLKFLLPGSGCASSTILLIPCYPGPHFHILHPQWPFINPQDSSNGFRSAMAANRHGAALGVSTPCSLGNTRRAPTRFNER